MTLPRQESCENVHKAKETITSVARNASCSHGWLRLVVQYIFGAITIISFILIVYMSMNSGKSSQDVRCRAQGCKVTCNDAPSLGSHEQDVIDTVRALDSNCDNILLVLHDPMFINSTIPEKWLGSLSSCVYELEIIGGNMKYIAPHAFMTTFAGHIQRLSFQLVSISSWVPEIFVGLSNLKEIRITFSYLQRINENALKAVDDTLETLSITHSDYFDPTNLTGSSDFESLTTVIFSNNNFNNILNRKSFKKLRKCKALYLNSCRINAIGEGAFDYLESIEILYLNNNFLIVLPNGIFNQIMSITTPRPRINLQDNLWYCDCSIVDIQQLVSSNLLHLDPMCYYPSDVRSLTFTEFIERCNNNTTPRTNTPTFTSLSDINTIRMDGECNTARTVSTLISPIEFLPCSLKSNENSKISDIVKEIMRLKKRDSNELLQTQFAWRGDSSSMLELISTGTKAMQNVGLLWYQESCPYEIYCISELPSSLRVYNTGNNVEYTFCPITLKTGSLHTDECIFYSLVSSTRSRTTATNVLRILSYTLTTILCTTIGACIVYVIIRKFPYLLKGSDRILIVKHKNVDALVLPPKVPLRENIVKNDHVDSNFIFTLQDNKFLKTPFTRRKSMRSVKSIAPSYISAMQPTEEQLTEWRLKQHFDNNMTISSVAFDVPFSILSDNESMYCSLDETSSKNYESLK